MSNANNKIILKGGGRADERDAAGSITPGHLLQINSSDAYVVHAVEGGYTNRIFAIENSLVGGVITDAYASGARVASHIAVTGSVVNALLAPGVSYAIGDELISAGNGTLKKASAASSGVVLEDVVGTVAEALDLSASGAVAARAAVLIR